MIRWLKRTAARVLLRASGELVRLGLKLTGETPAIVDEGEDVPAPSQNPLTEASREMMVTPTPHQQTKPEPEPPLAGSARERYLKAREKRLN